MSQHFKSNQYVERQKEIQYIGDALEQLKKQPEAKIINFYGIFGIGKTYLVRQLFDQLRETYNVVRVSFDPPSDSRPWDDQSEGLSFDKVVARLRQIPALSDLPDNPTLDNYRMAGEVEQVICDIALDAGDAPLLFML